LAPGQNAYTRSYSYDRIGNITYKSDVGSYAYTYNNQPHAVRTAGAVSLQYDLAGNMTQKVSNGVTLGITWNADNRPTLITRNGSDYIQYTYDGNGTRVRKVNLATGFVTRYYGEVYEERGATGVIHLFASTTRIASVRTDGTIQYYHGNHLGSASVITDSTGTVKETIEYLPFGSYRDRQDLDGSFPNVNYTFTDQEDDDETGFYNYRARLYDPLLGRFISADSIIPEPGNLQAFNRYSYCVNNPLVYTDPSGHDFGLTAFIVTVVIGAAIGAGVAATTGGDIATGALTGAVSAAAFYGAGTLIEGIRVSASMAAVTEAGAISEYAMAAAYQQSVSSLGAASIHAGAGALAGGVNAAITSDDVAKGAAVGGISSGLGTLSGGLIRDDFGSQLVGRSLIGGVSGGISSTIYGGNFGKGFRQGAMMAGFAVLFNEGADRAWLVIQAGGDFATPVRGAGGGATGFFRGDESAQLSASANSNIGLGGSKGPSFGLVYTDDPSNIVGSLNVCAVVCVSIQFSKSGWPVGATVGRGGAGAWWSHPLVSETIEWE